MTIDQKIIETFLFCKNCNEDFEKQSKIIENIDDSKFYNYTLNSLDTDKIQEEIQVMDLNLFYDDIGFVNIVDFRLLLVGFNKTNLKFFTIQSRQLFNELESDTFEWGQSVIFHPLNDHSRNYLEKGDMLFCHRMGQFSSLSEGLNIRGIYGVGIVISEPEILFPDEDKDYKKWGVKICFPFRLQKKLSHANIQSHPLTIDLTPYNGNRSDSLIYIKDLEKAYTLLKMLSIDNELIKVFVRKYIDNCGTYEFPQNILRKAYNIETSYERNENDRFSNWMRIKYSPKTVSNYLNPVKGKFNEICLSNGWLDTPLIDLRDLNKFKIVMRKLLEIEEISNLDTRGKGMYRASLLAFENFLKESQFSVVEFTTSLLDSNFTVNSNLTKRFVVSVMTKPFTILTGLAGSGKTKIAEALSLWITESKDQYCMVSVGADWTNREPLLGYPNALESEKYVKPDNGVVDLLQRADKDKDRPYFLILDEMNLSHVERYFADFLSAMESTDREIDLHSNNTIKDVPCKIILPRNLFIIGTVNVDETTYMFSPKVLDRANVIEFRVSKDEIESYFDEPKELNFDILRSSGVIMAEDFVHRAKKKYEPYQGLKDILVPIFSELYSVGAEFGYRTASEISRYISIYKELVEDSEIDEIIDGVIIQKLLPKLHGSRRKISPVLDRLAVLCVKTEYIKEFTIDKYLKQEFSNDYIKYPLTLDKISRMYTRAVQDGFTSFAEA